MTGGMIKTQKTRTTVGDSNHAPTVVKGSEMSRNQFSLWFYSCHCE